MLGSWPRRWRGIGSAGQPPRWQVVKRGGMVPDAATAALVGQHTRMDGQRIHLALLAQQAAQLIGGFSGHPAQSIGSVVANQPAIGEVFVAVHGMPPAAPPSKRRTGGAQSKGISSSKS